MFGEKDPSSNHHCVRDESSQSKLSRLYQNKESPVEKTIFSRMGIDSLRESKVGLDGPRSSQELTLSYLFENRKDFPRISFRGEEVVDSGNSNQDEKWVERDFLNLDEIKGVSSKRDSDEDFQEREKRQKLETLNLSLAPPDVSLSLTASNALQNGDASTRHRSRPSRSVQSFAPSTNMQTTCSNDFTAASLSYTPSAPFSHNPSCSFTRNSTENYEYSAGKDDQIWCGGEGTNGSVHSRFRPIDGVALAGAGVLCNSLQRTSSSDNWSLFPSELAAKPCVDNHSGIRGGGIRRIGEFWIVWTEGDPGRFPSRKEFVSR
ncbi:Zinc finger protein 4 [Hibiscus syriacus]|uniref:Zinc finger protein 4 n=1 Tax=Hibiscus syriacus TaxID=106335 RepID=A0A6A2XY09_HIBSY|nr:Zinc finger protein 4 [Hibiscus syriacus]